MRPSLSDAFDRRVVGAVALAILLVFAGCVGFGGDNGSPTPGADSTESPSPSPTVRATQTTTTATVTTPVPSTETTEQPALTGPTPPGVDSEGLDDVGTLLAANQRQTVNGTFHSVLDVRYVSEDDSNRDIVAHQVVASADADAYRYRTTYERRSFESGSLVREETGSHERWTNGSLVLERQRLRSPLLNDTDYGVVRDDVDRRTALHAWSELLDLGAFDNASQQAGMIRLTADDAVRYPTYHGIPVTTYDGAIEVDESGQIHTINISVVMNASGRTITETMVYDLATGEATVDRPDWADTARDRGIGLATSTNGSIVEVRNVGGTPIAANTTVQLGPFSSLNTTTLDESLRPGETVYLSKQGGTLTATRSMPETGDELTGSSVIRVIDDRGFNFALTTTVQFEE